MIIEAFTLSLSFCLTLLILISTNMSRIKADRGKCFCNKFKKYNV